jgi:putative transposase
VPGRHAGCKCHVFPFDTNDLAYGRDSIVAGRFFNPFLLLVARLTNKELVEAVQFLKVQNKILRSKLPRVVTTTRKEQKLLVKLGKALGAAVKELISIVSYRTYLRWKAAEKKGKGKGKDKKKAPNKHPHRTPEEVRELVIRMANENDWGYTRI